MISLAMVFATRDTDRTYTYTGALSYTLQGQAFFRLPIPAFQRALTSRPDFDIGNTFNNVPLRESQMLLAADDAGSLGVAKTFIEAKIYNCRWVI